MTEMVYQPELTRKCLQAGIYKGVQYEIVSYGTHPCAYVEVPYRKLGTVKVNRDLDLACHGGITYYDDSEFGNSWVGWDYHHSGDFSGIWDTLYKSAEEVQLIHGYTKKWTTEEIFSEVKEVIERIKPYRQVL